LNLIINHTSMEPIYEQIVAQIKAEVIEGRMTAGDALPSVRTLSRELKISALTVKKAYDNLEEEGLIVTVHGKGSFIAAANQELLMEERRKELEKELEAAVQKARTGGLTAKEIRESFEIIMEDEVC
jgi:GntR family transcriptional regulator